MTPLLLAALASTNITVVVTASPIAQEERNTFDGAEVVEIGSAQMGRLSAQDLPTALRHVPGVTISRFSPIGSFGGAQGGSVFIRGTGESRPGGTLTVAHGMSAEELARMIINDVLKTTGITATAGIAPNLFNERFAEVEIVLIDIYLAITFLEIFYMVDYE